MANRHLAHAFKIAALSMFSVGKIAAGVAEKRGAGIGCIRPAGAAKVARAWL